ncbi:MAG TPA: enoyl-CoA hydratase/isomerase family protein, partial [Verrucomicrobiae bacterium]|nr:enoyl-CoA hydratase/isomerase family protein [Verrucomicrobiae bacterium]
MITPRTFAERLAVDIRGPLARITLTHPPLNVIDFQMMDELLAALQQLEQQSEVVAVILGGNERAFSAGVDVGIHTPDKIETMLQKF